jgi:prepilin-type N-terminal cleavage/methylation domain-containing protein
MQGRPGQRAELRRRVLSMRALASIVRRRLAAQEGFTLPELLMAAALSLLIATAALMMFSTVLRSQPGLSARDQAIRDGRVVMERVIREIRQGESLDTGAGDSWSPQTLSFRTYVHSATCGGSASSSSTAIVCRVTYACSSGTCTRREADPNTGAQGSAIRLVSGLASSSVFQYQSDPSTECQSPPGVSNEAVSLRDEATLRNSDSQSPSRVCVSLVFPKG